jgi:hypothetical protein
VDGIVRVIKRKGTSNNLIVGGDFETISPSAVFNYIGSYDTVGSGIWNQIFSTTGGVGVSAPVRDIFMSATIGYIVGDFQTIANNTIVANRVVRLNDTNQIEAMTNITNTRQGTNAPIYGVTFLNPKVFLAGEFSSSATNTDVSMRSLGYYDIRTLTVPLTLISAGLFLNTENGLTYNNIQLSTRYKNIYIIYNTSLNKWLVTYRSATGISFI